MLVKFLTYDLVKQYDISKSAVFHKYQHIFLNESAFFN